MAEIIIDFEGSANRRPHMEEPTHIVSLWRD